MATKTYTQYLEEILNSQKQLEKDKLNAIDTEYDTLKQQVKSQYAGDISAAQGMYDEYIDKSYVQKLIDKKQIEETMSNMGLNDSGLKKTKQAASELSHSSIVANYNALKQQKINSLAQAMHSKITELDAKKAKSRQDVKDSLYKSAESKATQLFNKQESERIKQESQLTKQKKEWLNIVNTLFDENTTEKKKNSLVEQYYSKYGFTNNEKALLEKANIYKSSVGQNTQKKQTTVKTEFNISDERKTELLKMCRNGLFNRSEFSNEVRIGTYKGEYDIYRKEKLQQWMTEGKIDQTEYSFLLQELGIN